MNKSSETSINESVSQESLNTGFDTLANVPFSPDSDSINDTNGEVLKEGPEAIEMLRDHFPDDIAKVEHFKREDGPSPLQTEEDYKNTFTTFTQEELVPTLTKDGYIFDRKIWPYEKTAKAYISLAQNTVYDLAGYTGKLPQTDVAIYLDKSARPVSWFVNEFWDSTTKSRPQPRTEHLSIDRKRWFKYFNIDIDNHEYIKDTDRLAGWRDIPVNSVTKEDITKLLGYLRDGTITHDQLEVLANKKSGDKTKIENAIKAKYFDAIIEEKERNGEDYDYLETKAIVEKKAKFLISGRHDEATNTFASIENIYDSLKLAAQIRGLFVPGGLSEEDVKCPERIFDYPVDMDGKNITIIDEVERSGTTMKVAQNFVSWAFPEAKSVNKYIFYNAEKLLDSNSTQDRQMLRIPFWYPLTHDDGRGRGVLEQNAAYYEAKYNSNPNDVNRAANFGSAFIATPMEDYYSEPGQKSIKLREQITKLRVEYEKGHILFNK